MVGNAEAERMFSTMNGIKTDLRNQLKDGQLERLIRMSDVPQQGAGRSSGGHRAVPEQQEQAATLYT